MYTITNRNSLKQTAILASKMPLTATIENNNAETTANLSPFLQLRDNGIKATRTRYIHSPHRVYIYICICSNLGQLRKEVVILD